jgi:outer membrane lipoprotein
MKSIVLILLASCYLVGCASKPIPMGIQHAPEGDLQLVEAINNIEQHRETNVRWGGRIVGYEQKDGDYYIQILQSPLGHKGRPLIEQKTDGRFVLFVPKPDESKPEEITDVHIAMGDYVTVNGNIQGTQEVKVGKQSMSIPLISVNEIYTWQATRNHHYYDPYFDGYYHAHFHNRFFFYGGWYRPFYRPFYRPYYRPIYRPRCN